VLSIGGPNDRADRASSQTDCVGAKGFVMKLRRAFTLVELLVVIGIIAVLIGILLPTLGKAQEAARRTTCLSQLRELANSLRIYGTENKDICPIGGIAANPSSGAAGTNPDMQYGFTYTVFWKGSSGQGIAGLGYLAFSGLLKTPKTFYCPSEPDPGWMYNTPENPWCFFGKGELQFPPSGPVNCRLSYNSRPAAAYQPVHTDVRQRNVPQLTDPPYPRAFPKYSSLKNKAIVADLLAYPSAVTRRHKGGINVLYANGSGQWIELGRFDKADYLSGRYKWKTIATGAFPQLPDSYAFYNPRSDYVGGPNGAGLWNLLDRASR
jgi:prepilin-type N-terminal cleavage/methylation domain-containing protein